MITEIENFEDIKFEIISKKTFKVKESLIFSLIFIMSGGSLFLLSIYFYSLGNLVIPSLVSIAIILSGVTSLIRYIIQYQYMIQNRDFSKSVEEYNEKPKLNNFSESHHRCNGCNKNLNPILFKLPEENLIKLFKFRGIWITGHFCKDCIKSYFLIELLFLLLIAFLWELSAITIYLLYIQNFIISIITVLLIIVVPIGSIIILLVDRIKILRKYK